MFYNLKGETVMEGKYCIHINDKISKEGLKILSLTFSSCYEEALSMLDELVAGFTDEEDKQLAGLIAAQILMYSGKKALASVLLEAIHGSLKSEKAKSVCQRTIETL